MTNSQCAEQFVLVTAGPRFALVRARRWDGVRAHLQARFLDRELASGTAAESDRLLAVRARQLVGRPRRRLAARWRSVAATAPRCPELWRVADFLDSGAASARTVAAASTALPAAIRAAAHPQNSDLAAAAARAVFGAA